VLQRQLVLIILFLQLHPPQEWTFSLSFYNIHIIIRIFSGLWIQCKTLDALANI
jgi:hypothetical protein